MWLRLSGRVWNLRRRLSLANQCVAAMPDAALLYDLRAHAVLQVSDAFRAEYGYTATGARALTLLTLVAAADRPRMIEAIQRRRARIMMDVRHADGTSLLRNACVTTVRADLVLVTLTPYPAPQRSAFTRVRPSNSC